MAGIDAILTENASGVYDMTIDSNGDIASGDQYDTAILVSLFTDRRALASEVARPERRRGWIGNEVTPGIEMGSRLWLLEQERATREVANLASDWATEALRWLVDDGYAIAVTATASFTASTLMATIQITRPTGDVETRLVSLWDNTGVGYDGS